MKKIVKTIYFFLSALIIGISFGSAAMQAKGTSNDITINTIHSLETKRADLKKQLVAAQKEFDSAPYNSAEANAAQNKINNLYAEIEDINRQLQRLQGKR